MIEWVRTYWKGRVTSLAVTPRGDLIVVGEAEKRASVPSKYKAFKKYRKLFYGEFIAKFGRDMSLKWFRILPSIVVSDVKTVDNREIIACGWIKRSSEKGSGVVFKFDGDGNLIWGRRFDGGVVDAFNAIAVTRDGGAVVVGETRSFGAGVSDALILRLDKDGNFLWWKTCGDRLWDSAKAVAIGRDGRITVAGYTYSFIEGPPNAWIIWLDDAGGVLMERTYGTKSMEKATLMTLTPEGDPVVAGETYNLEKSRYEGWVLRINREGEPRWGIRFPGKIIGDISANSNGEIVLIRGNSLLTGLSASGEPLWGESLESLGSVGTILTDKGLLVGGSASGKALIASVIPEGQPPIVSAWNPRVSENKCIVFDSYSHGMACLKESPLIGLVEKKLKPTEFEPEIFRNFKDFILKWRWRHL